MKFKVTKTQVLVGLLLAGGVGWSVMDFREWKHAELDKYGQGYGEKIPAMALGSLYENQFWSFRIRYPEGWTADTAREFSNVPAKKKRSEALFLGQRKVVVWLGKYVKVSIEKVNRSLVDLADSEKMNLTNKKIEFLREREYVNTDEVGVIFMTWKDGEIVYQRALAQEGDRMVIVDSSAVETEWNGLEPTFWEMYKSLIIF